ncbi:MAG: amidohydrolase family protein, partial [Gammaproteobacteria bacterium]|nr:amidohydrolase family protein [Gammaproteobacteria bacterium]
MPILRTCCLLVLTLCGLALTAACSDKPREVADTVFLDAKVYTVNSAQPWAEAIAISGDTIVYVGDNDGAMDLIGDTTQQINLDGKLLLPGFIDTHLHPLAGGEFARALSLQTNGTIEGWVLAIDEFAKANPDARVIFGYGFLATTFGPEGPTRQLIDTIVPDRPVLIIDEGFHGAWANTAALEALNITQDTADPVPGYSYYKRDENGDATGYLLEETAFTAMDALDVINDEVIIEGTGLVIEIMNSYGV